MNLKKLLAAASLATATVMATTPAFADDTIYIASEGAYAPFNTIDKDGNLQGFDIDVGKALCKQMEAKCEFVAQDWSGLIQGLQAQRYDAIIASMSITDKRKRVVDFTDPYYSNKLAFIVAKDNKTEMTKEGLKGLNIGAQRSTLAGQYAREHFSDVANIKLYDTQDQAYMDMSVGRLDVLVSDKYPAYNWLKTEAGDKFEFRGDDIDIDDKIGIALRKNSPLKARFNKALKAIVDNGTYAKINAKYFPFSIY